MSKGPQYAARAIELASTANQSFNNGFSADASFRLRMATFYLEAARLASSVANEYTEEYGPTGSMWTIEDSFDWAEVFRRGED